MLLQKHQCHSRGVAKINRLHLALHLREHRRNNFFNTSRVILRFFMLPSMLFFPASCTKTTILLPMRVPATLFRRSKLFWLQPGACLYSRYPLNPSHKHVFVAAFWFLSRSSFLQFFAVGRSVRRSTVAAAAVSAIMQHQTRNDVGIPANTLHIHSEIYRTRVLFLSHSGLAHNMCHRTCAGL